MKHEYEPFIEQERKRAELADSPGHLNRRQLRDHEIVEGNQVLLWVVAANYKTLKIGVIFNIFPLRRWWRYDCLYLHELRGTWGTVEGR
ncbi:BZ3500_MvSof-1268-A1-R1_Chr11-3g03604 [Microbotryum saponariae]|uniref:BZ3500_MvSof-1268-A1-R1_Chr11-3g03604 protein n=1 Tax=Microbotryum saponariae TaxID=289078 RepID=A0A2X0LW45_9BASI|nr:BZ3500_MvSof-1268-A1-R1_Chr11-3g03604 [Microbotryum saponariae]SDA03613.1 BZ3501_MvSof-1269-A2-R1_Chr11g03181 [Microbotryum saponariae]